MTVSLAFLAPISKLLRGGPRKVISRGGKRFGDDGQVARRRERNAAPAPR